MNKELFYESIADNFDSIMNMYDTNRRIEVIFEDFLGREDLTGKTLLDGGCGTGWFTSAAAKRGAQVSSVDISEKLVEITQAKNPGSIAVQASILNLPFATGTFDYVISSDVIEHTPDPQKAVLELIRVLKPGGKLCLTVPNKTTWYFTLWIARVFHLREYNGFENWQHYYAFRKFIRANGIELIAYKGIHLFPFVINALNKILYRLDRILAVRLGVLCVNIGLYGIKKPGS